MSIVLAPILSHSKTSLRGLSYRVSVAADIAARERGAIERIIGVTAS
jgi:hypothetical protein